MNEPAPVVTPFLAWPAALELILASRSPRRSELLRTAGIPFVCQPADDVEAELGQQLLAAKTHPGQYVEKLALAKAANVAKGDDQRLVLGADTVVVLDGKILEKPSDEADACHILAQMSGRKHTVLTAVALVGGPAGSTGLVQHEATQVEFLPITAATIERYVATGEPMDKAGAYGIQGYGALMVRSVQGCYFNVMGLPLARLGEMLRQVLSGA